MNLLCKLGFHKWGKVVLSVVLGKPGLMRTRKCLWCGKAEQKETYGGQWK